MPSFFVPTKTKVLSSIGLLVASIGLSGLAYRFFDGLPLASTLFFPVRMYRRVRPLFREPGYQDITYGECLIPYCDQASAAITIVLSGLIYYSLAVLILRALAD